MIFRCLNTKNGKEYTYTLKEVNSMFEAYTWCENHILQEDYDEYYNSLETEEEKQNFINYWEDKEIYDNEQAYYIDMIEYITWTSPRGVEPEYRVIEVKEKE